jgi:hypothetical protein
MTEVAPSRALAEELVRRWRSVTTTARSEDGGRTEPRVPEQLSFAQEGIWAAERLRASTLANGIRFSSLVYRTAWASPGRCRPGRG